MAEMFTIQDAIALHKEGQYENAIPMFEAIVCREPDSWYPYFFLASCNTAIGKNANAIAALRAALAIKPDSSELWNNYGTVLRRENHFEKSRDALLKGTEIKPEDADLWSNLCTLYVNEGHPELGLEYANNALKYQPDHDNAIWNKSLLLLETGQLEEGFDLHRHGITNGERQKRWPFAETYDKRKHFDSRVLVYGEQGLGDEIMLMSMIPDLMKHSRELIVECHPRLESLVKHAFPDLEVHPTRKKTVIQDWRPEFDARIAAADVPHQFRNKPEDFPRTQYLSADEELVETYSNRLRDRCGSGPYIGIGWKGGYKKTRKDLRSINLEAFLPIIKQVEEMGGAIISMQYTPDADIDVQRFNAKHNVHIHHWPDIVRADDYMHTAAMAQALDLVVSVNTSLVHLCGALGKECWTLTPFGCAWRYWCWDDHMMWYESVTQYRQDEGKDWSDPINKVKDDLKKTFQSAVQSKKEVAT